MRPAFFKRGTEFLPIRSKEQLAHPELRQLNHIAIEASLASARAVSKVSQGSLRDLHVEYKSDATPRTIADTEGDIAIVKAIRSKRPQDAISIEESGYHPPDLTTARRRDRADNLTWYADSLDGTRPFTEGKNESTVGIVVCDKDGNYLAASVVHPFRRQLIYAAKGQGAYLMQLDADLKPIGSPQKISVSSKTSLEGATIAIDAYYTNANTDRKTSFVADLTRQAIGTERRGTLSLDQTGSNIAYQFDVARGATAFGLTDAVGGPWDWRVGEAIITEAGGVMVDVATNSKPTDQSTVVVYGNRSLVDRMLLLAQSRYIGYQGFK